MAYRTKPGKHGTLYLYEFAIKDRDPGVPTEKQRYWGYDAEHAAERLWNDLSFQGWDYPGDYGIIGSPKRVKE